MKIEKSKIRKMIKEAILVEAWNVESWDDNSWPVGDSDFPEEGEALSKLEDWFVDVYFFLNDAAKPIEWVKQLSSDFDETFGPQDVSSNFWNRLSKSLPRSVEGLAKLAVEVKKVLDLTPERFVLMFLSGGRNVIGGEAITETYNVFSRQLALFYKDISSLIREIKKQLMIYRGYEKRNISGFMEIDKILEMWNSCLSRFDSIRNVSENFEKEMNNTTQPVQHVR